MAHSRLLCLCIGFSLLLFGCAERDLSRRLATERAGRQQALVDNRRGPWADALAREHLYATISAANIQTLSHPELSAAIYATRTGECALAVYWVENKPTVKWIEITGTNGRPCRLAIPAIYEQENLRLSHDRVSFCVYYEWRGDENCPSGLDGNALVSLVDGDGRVYGKQKVLTKEDYAKLMSDGRNSKW